MLVDIYVNYDCDLEAPNLFERMVCSFSSPFPVQRIFAGVLAYMKQLFLACYFSIRSPHCLKSPKGLKV